MDYAIATRVFSLRTMLFTSPDGVCAALPGGRVDGRRMREVPPGAGEVAREDGGAGGQEAVEARLRRGARRRVDGHLPLAHRHAQSAKAAMKYGIS